MKHTKLAPIFFVLMLMFSSFGFMIPGVSAGTPSLIYSDDFETGTDGWTISGSVADSTDQAHGGTHSLKVTSSFPAPTSCYHSMTVNYSNQVSFWFYADTMAATGMVVLYQLGTSYTPCLVLQDYSGTTKLRVSLNGNTGPYTNVTTVTMDAWHHLYVNATSRTSYTIDYDGVRQGTTWGAGSTNTGSGSTVNVFFCPPGSPAGCVIYMDDLQVYYWPTWAPTITNAPATLYAHIDQVYYYNITTNESCTYTLLAGINAGVLNTTTGRYTINLSAYWCGYWGVPTGYATGPYLTEIRATSVNGTRAAYIFFNVTVTPVEWMPTFISSPSSSGRVGTTYYYNSSLNETCTYNVSTYPAWANVSDPTHIHGVPTLYGSYSFVLKARSVNGTLTRTQSWTVTVVNATTWAPTITSSPVTKMVYGSRYYYNLTTNESVSVLWLQIWTEPGGYTLTNGNKNYAWTPFAAGTYHFSVRATSVNGSEATIQSWDLVVLAHGWFTTVTSTPPVIGYANHTYWYNITTNESCTVTLVSAPAWRAYSLPITLVTGTPTVQGYYSFSYKIVSTGGLLTTYHNWTVHILVENPWAPTFMSVPTTRIIHTPTANWYYNITLNASCTIIYYVGPSWVYGTGITPDGTIPGTSFNISGHPEVGVWQFAIRATAVDGMLSAYQWWNVTVLGTGWAPTITSVPESIAYCNETYYYNLTANESVSITWVTYPASWINVLDPTHIYGMPYYISSYTMKATVYSLSGMLYVNQTWTITTHPQILWYPVITSTPTTTATMGSSYTYDVNANETCTYELLAYLNAATINATSGEIAIDLSPASVQYWGIFAGTYLFQVQATSVAGHGSVTQTWYVTISGHEWIPSFTCTPITGIRSGETYTLLITVNESCIITGLDIPSWLTLTNDDQISSYQHWLNGTAPAGNGTYYVRIRATGVLSNEAAYLSYNVQVVQILPITPSSGLTSFLMFVTGMMTLLCLPIAATYWKYGDDGRKAALWVIAFLIFAVMFFGLLGT